MQCNRLVVESGQFACEGGTDQSREGFSTLGSGYQIFDQTLEVWLRSTISNTLPRKSTLRHTGCSRLGAIFSKIRVHIAKVSKQFHR